MSASLASCLVLIRSTLMSSFQCVPTPCFCREIGKLLIGLDKSAYQVNIFLIFPQKCVVGTH